MPSNILHAPFDCPACGLHHEEGVWEFSHGALAGEDYFVGDTLRYDEDFSFFARTVGQPNDHVDVIALGQCPSGPRLVARLVVVGGLLKDLREVAKAPEKEKPAL